MSDADERAKPGPAPAARGFTYVVSDAQLAQFATATIAQRIEWLEHMQQWSWNNASPEVRAAWAERRRG